MQQLNNKKLLVILGPTASGKSDLAIDIAKQFNGEIISADSRQVYKGMDIGTGKVKIQKIHSPKFSQGKFEKTKKSKIKKIKNAELYSEGIRHHLLDVISPKKYFSVAQYQKLTLKTIKDIQKRGKLPILCGGTGFYISSVLEGWQFPKIKPNLNLREKLEKLTSDELFLKLKKINPQRAATIDKNNKRRLGRALEIILHNKKIEPLRKNPLKMDILIIGIQKDKEELKKRIEKRLDKRLKQGMVKEVKELKRKGVSSKRLENFGLEYRFINRYLENKINYQEMRKSLLREIIKYAKRQMTWFRNKIQNINWIKNPQTAKKLVIQWLEN